MMSVDLFKQALKSLQLFLSLQAGTKQGVICDLDTNQMFLCRLLGPGFQIQESFLFSRSQAPLCNLENSFGTPMGLHVICEKIGEEVPINGELIARKFTGQVVPIAKSENEKGRITTRILRLKGLQWGINKGIDLKTHRFCDSYKRCIYIHGTNLENFIPKPLSKGCLLLKTQDLTYLFRKVNIGDFCLLLKRN